jgi:hypothetical protein
MLSMFQIQDDNLVKLEGKDDIICHLIGVIYCRCYLCLHVYFFFDINFYFIISLEYFHDHDAEMSRFDVSYIMIQMDV